jgi:hypothetical protein
LDRKINSVPSKNGYRTSWNLLIMDVGSLSVGYIQLDMASFRMKANLIMYIVFLGCFIMDQFLKAW